MNLFIYPYQNILTLHRHNVYFSSINLKKITFLKEKVFDITKLNYEQSDIKRQTSKTGGSSNNAISNFTNMNLRRIERLNSEWTAIHWQTAICNVCLVTSCAQKRQQLVIHNSTCRQSSDWRIRNEGTVTESDHRCKIFRNLYFRHRFVLSWNQINPVYVDA